MSKKYKKENNEYTIRSINLKLVIKEELVEKMNAEFDMFSTLHDIGVNRYTRLPDTEKETIAEEAKRMRRELKSDTVSGTFVDLAIGRQGAESYFHHQQESAWSDILDRDEEIKKLEKENINLIKPESVWFNPVKKVEGKCCMCGREGKMPHYSNEFKEALCEVCAVDFFKYRIIMKSIKRHVMKNYFLCKDMVGKEKLSKGLIKEIDRFEEHVKEFKGTISNKVKLKGGPWKVDFEKRLATIPLKKTREYIQVEFLGDHYYTEYPKYGLLSDEHKFKSLILDSVKRKRAASLIRKKVSGDSEPPLYEYYLSIPTRYPMHIKEKVEGCILVSPRRVLIYINGAAKFVELYNPYLKKRIYEVKQKEIQGENKNLCICDWNRLPDKSHMFLTNLRKKMGFDWVNDYDVTVKKSEDGKTVIVTDDNDINRSIEISTNQEAGIAELRSIDNDKCSNTTLYIVESKKNLEKKENSYRKKELYLNPQVPMPKKYAGGNLLKHVIHKNKETARHIVEETKKMLSDEGSVLLVNYTGIHPEKETKIPIISLNDQIYNMLRYDSIYRGSIHWDNLKLLICPNCHTALPEKKENRFIIRDIFVGKMKSWICQENRCDERINNPLIAVARHIMTSDIKELLKKRKKEKEVNSNEKI